MTTPRKKSYYERKKERGREYHAENREVMLQCMRDYHQDHKETINKKKSQYRRETTRIFFGKKRKIYRAKNKEKMNAKTREYRLANPEKYRKSVRNSCLKINYGITLEEWNAMFAAQNMRCAICDSQSPGTQTRGGYHTDHCHSSGKVRGILCNACNLMLGAAKDKVEVLENAIEYLKLHK